MKRAISTCILLFWSCIAMSNDTPKIYLKSLHAYTLGYSHVEFYEAYLVTSMGESELGSLMQHVRGLCNEFPMLDKYVIRVFSNDKMADPQIFESTFGSSLGGKLSKASLASVNSYFAEINPKGELVLFPFSDTKRKVINVGHDWCNKKI